MVWPPTAVCYAKVEKLAQPFHYRLCTHAERQTYHKLVGTSKAFNDLLGLHGQTQHVYDDDRRRSVGYRDRMDQRSIAAIRRETKAGGETMTSAAGISWPDGN